MGTGWIREISKNLLALAFGLLFMLIVLEVFLRVFYPLEFKTRHNKLFCEYDSMLGWKHIPSAKGTHISDEYSIHESFNSKGIRGPEYSYDKDDGEYRILILGDSFAEGYMVEFNELFSEVLKAKLNYKAGGHKYFQVINAGTGGWSTDQELLFFQIEGKKYNPDLTILMFCHNDVWYNNQPKYWRGYKPTFKINGEELTLTNVPVPKPDAPEESITSVFYERVIKWPPKKSHLYNFVNKRIKTLRPYLQDLTTKLHIMKSLDEKATIPKEFRIWEKTYNAKIRKAWNITEALIIKLQEEAASVGSKLLVFYIPNRAQIYSKDWEDTKRKYGISEEDWNINQCGIELEAICKRNNISFFNPTKLFMTEAGKLIEEGKRLYFVKDGHWNAIGNKFVGQILSQHVTINYLENNK